VYIHPHITFRNELHHRAKPTANYPKSLAQKTQKTKTPAKEKRHQLVVKLLLFLDALGLFLWRTIALYITAFKL